MSKASWEDTPPIRRLIARILKLAGFPDFKTSPMEEDSRGALLLGNSSGVFAFEQSPGPTDYLYTGLSMGTERDAYPAASPAQIYSYVEDDRPGGADFAEATTLNQIYLDGSEAGHTQLYASELNGRTSAGLVGYIESGGTFSLVAGGAGDGQTASAGLQIRGRTNQTQPLLDLSGGTGVSTGVKVLPNGDVEILDSAAGVILHSPDNTKHRIKVANNGTLSTEVVT